MTVSLSRILELIQGQQAARVSDYTAFMYLGEPIEFNQKIAIYVWLSKADPGSITGRFG